MLWPGPPYDVQPEALRDMCLGWERLRLELRLLGVWWPLLWSLQPLRLYLTTQVWVSWHTWWMIIVTWILSSCSCLSDSRPRRRWGCWGWGGRCRWRWWRWARWSRRRGCPRPGRSSSHCAGRLEQAWLRWGRGGGQSWESCYRGHPSSLRTTWPDNIDHQSLLHSVVLLFSVQISWCYLV